MNTKYFIGTTYFTEWVSYATTIGGIATLVYGIAEKNVDFMESGLYNSLLGLAGAIISRAVRGTIKRNDSLESKL